MLVRGRRAPTCHPRPAGARRCGVVFHNRNGGAYLQHNLRRTFREYLELAGLEGSGISFRWYRRTGATVLARAVSVDAASVFLGHTSTAITEAYHIEPDRTVDLTPAAALDSVLRPGSWAARRTGFPRAAAG